MKRFEFLLALIIFVVCALGSVANCQTTLIRDIEISLQYDEYGNITQVSRSTGDGYSDGVNSSFQYNPSAWLVAMPQLSTETSTSAPWPIGTGQTVTRTTQFVNDT